MNKVILIGRLTDEPDIRTTQEGLQIARYTLAVDRRFKKQNDAQTADFINCVAFGKQGEFAEKYMSKGHKFCVCGRIQTGSYVNRENRKVYTTDVIVEETYFIEKKAENDKPDKAVSDGFIKVPDNVAEDLPFV